MSRCQHCGQGAIAQDANGPVCPDCWEEGHYEMGSPMNNKPEAPDLLPCPFCGGTDIDPKSGGVPECFTCGATAFNSDWNTRADLSDAKDKRIEELEAGKWVTKAYDLEFHLGEAQERIAELEAKLAHATEQYRLIGMDKIDLVAKVAELEAKLATASVYVEHVAEQDLRLGWLDDWKDTLRDVVHDARATLAELKGTDDE